MLWNIFERFNIVNKIFQFVETELETVINLYNSFVRYLECKRDMFDLYEEEAMNMTWCKYIQLQHQET